MDEEYAQIYVWPADHKDGETLTDAFYQKLDEVLRAAGIEWETV